MKKCGLWLMCILAPVAPALAQLTVEVSLSQNQYLSGEALPVAVRITNHSGRAVRLGGDNDWLTFSVEGRESLVVRQTGDVPVAGEFELQNSQRATKHIELAPYFVLGEPGHYKVVATIRVKDWDFQTSSEPAGFDVIQGTKLWEQEFGVPNTGGADGTPEIRKYVLQQANYLRTGLALFLRVTDATAERSYRVVHVGGLLSFSRPEAQVDRQSRLHLLYQDGPRSFGYFVFDTSGELIVRQTHDYVNSRPRLQVDDSGNVFVTGGMRRMASTDLPTSKPPERPDAAPAQPGSHDDAAPKL